MKDPNNYESTQAEKDDYAEFYERIKLNPHDFVDYALPRTREPDEIITDVMRFNRSRAREYFISTMGSGKRHLYDHTTFLKIWRGIK